MKYSVVIPLYNKQRYIRETLKSVLEQTFQDFEILVVDDGSSDESLKEAKKVVSEKIRIIEQPNQGVAVARNTGIQHAEGEYISFLDADDKWKKNYLETIDELTRKYQQSDIFVTAYAVDMGDGKINLSTQLTPEEGCLESYWLTLKEKYDFVWTSATTIRRDALLKAKLFRPGEKIGQDLDMWARVARNNPSVAYSAKACVEYNRSAEENARTRVKIAWARAFIGDLEEELVNPARTKQELEAIQHKYDLKMTVYIFTSILAEEKARAYLALKNWRGRRNIKNCLLRTGLRIACCMPAAVNRRLYNIRLKVF